MSMFGPVEIPNKSSFKINEVCALTGVKSYVLRFWESEFEEIAPLESSSGQKLYEYRDIEAILLIKKLLFEDKMSIERAKAEMKNLMPRESLVEEEFAESYNFEGEFTEEEKKMYAPSFVGASSQKSTTGARESVAPMAQRVLVESDFQKLVKAKGQLQRILALTETIQNKHDWI